MEQKAIFVKDEQAGDGMNYQPVIIDTLKVHDNRFSDGKRKWCVLNLIEQAKDLPVFDLPICCINIATSVWTPGGSPRHLVEHMKRVMAVDITKPVILDEDGFIMDGWHRVARALLDGRATIPAVRFNKTPPCNWIEESA